MNPRHGLIRQLRQQSAFGRRLVCATLPVAVFTVSVAVTQAAALTAGGAVAGRCGDADASGSVTASDSLFALQTAVGAASCIACRCDVLDRNGVFASDALGILNLAIALPVELDCPLCTVGQPCAAATDCESNVCEDGTCTDPCASQPDGTPCTNDGNACTIDECVGGTCQHAPEEDEVVCRASAGPCDEAEICDGTGSPCPDDQFASGEVCRPIQGGCDEDEECDGTSAQCPADAFTRAGAICRVPFGDCDEAETCSGDSPDCPVDAFLPAETVCRDAIGPCDAEETCSGASKDCPEDSLKQSSDVCRDAVGGCDAPEFCDGNTTDCPADLIAESGFACRESVGDCDTAETCDGVSTDCPTDLFLTGTCRASTGPCDPAELCQDGSPNCPDDIIKPAGEICNFALPGTCRANSVCNGFTGFCGIAYQPAGTICREAAGLCESPGTCDGIGPDCGQTIIKSAGTECRPAANELCDVAETCDGFSAQCPADTQASNDTVCHTADPENVCDDDRFCLNGGCPPATIDPTRICRDVPFGRGGYCDEPEFCELGPTGVPRCPPVDVVKPANTVCLRTPNDYCRADVRCNGISKACSPALASFEINGTACIDGSGTPGVCDAGACTLFGASCTTTPDCGVGQICIDCGPSGGPFDGRCADAEQPCCSAGGFVDDDFWCGDARLQNTNTCIGGPNDLEPCTTDLDCHDAGCTGDCGSCGSIVPRQCCGWKCFDIDDDQHCNGCGNNCIGENIGPPGANPCLFQPYSGTCSSEFVDILSAAPVCRGIARNRPNEICHEDGSIWTWKECDNDMDCPTGAICGGPSHDDIFFSNRATYGLCVLPYELQPPPENCVVDGQCPLGYSCHSETVTNPETFIKTDVSFCRWGIPCATHADCPAADFVFSGVCVNGICGHNPGMQEGKFENIPLCGGPCAGDLGGICDVDEDCDSGYCASGCGVSRGNLSFIGLCSESNICAPASE